MKYNDNDKNGNAIILGGKKYISIRHLAKKLVITRLYLFICTTILNKKELKTIKKGSQ